MTSWTSSGGSPGMRTRRPGTVPRREAGGAHVTTWIALLRGVNVGGRAMPMRDVRDALHAAGYCNVATYIQSGNVRVDAAEDDPLRVADGIRAAITAGTGHDVGVLVRTAEELAAVVAGCPFAADTIPRAGHVTFLASLPDPVRVAALEAGAGGADEFRCSGREVYLWCPAGYGRTRLTNAFFERRLAVAATTRNWRTVTVLAELAAAGRRERG